MLVEAPVVFPESEREAQTLPAANVARTSDACDADVRSFDPTALIYASQFHMQNYTTII